MRTLSKILGLVLFLASPLLAQPPGPPISPGSSGGSGNVTASGSEVCTDNQLLRANGTAPTAIQCSPLVVSDTTGNITGPAGGFSIIGGTGATDYLILDGSAGTAGNVSISEGGAVSASGIISTATNFSFDNPVAAGDDIVITHVNGVPLIAWSSGTSGPYLAKNGNAIEVRKTTTPMTLSVYGTSDAFGTLTNYERLSLSCDGTADCTIATETAGTGTDDMVLTVKGEGPAGTLVLDGSDDVAGSVSISASGVITATGDGTHQIIGGSGSGMTILGGGGGQRMLVGDTSVVFIPTYQQTWGSSEFSGADVGLARNAAGVVRVTDASTGIGKLLNARVVTPDIDGETTTAAQSATVWTNTGDTDGQTFTLLNDPTLGTHYCVAVDAAQTVTVAPSAGESLYFGTDQCVVSLTSNATGSTLCVAAVVGGSGGKWFTMSSAGSWTCHD